MVVGESAISPAIPIRFSTPLAFRHGANGIDLEKTTDSRFTAALASNKPFPPDVEFPLATVKVTASGGQDITFDSKQGPVNFSARADANAGLGLYVDPAHLSKDLGIDPYFGDAFTLPNPTSGYYLAINWGYDATASGQGSVAAGGTTVRFGADGTAVGKFAVVKKCDGNQTAPVAVVSAIDSWKLPSLISKPDDLNENTWLFAETDGGLRASLGVTYGYNFNWVREAALGGLSGDIGLKIQLGIEAELGFDISSAFAVVVSREAVHTVRVRLFKQPRKGWQFAFNAAAAVSPVTPELPEKLDDFVLSILDLHNQQLLMDLKDLKTWSSGQAPLAGALIGVAPRYMEQLLQSVSAAINGRQFDFERAKNQLLQFLDTWSGLDSKVAAAIWKSLPDKNLLAQMSDICQQIANCSASADYAAIVEKLAGQPAFMSSRAGQWLELLALGSILTPIENQNEFDKIKTLAGTTARFLTAGTSEQSILRALNTWIDSRIGLQAITKVTTSLELAQIDAWIKAKLQKFLGQSVLSLNDVNNVSDFISRLRGMASSVYEHARKALTDTYMFFLGALYQEGSNATALLDVTFDFGAVDANGADLSAFVQQAIAGDFHNILQTSAAGVKLNRALLTHHLTRHQHVEVRMPFYHSTFDEINRSLASFDAVGSDSGRVFFYQLDANDDIAAITNRGSSYSHLGLAAMMSSPNNARKHAPPEFSYSYVFRAASADMRRAQLQYQIGAYVDSYMGRAFQSGQASFDTWLSDLDRTVASAPSDHYGHTLLELDVELEARAVAAWLNAPSDAKSQAYMRMSLDLQKSGLKKLIPFYYFSDLHRYRDLGAAYPLIVFSCIPTAVSVNPDTLQMNFRDIYWDYLDPGLRHSMILRDDTREIVRVALTSISKRLAASGMANDAARYMPTDGLIDEIRRSVLDDTRLLGLLQSESQLLQGARAAGLAMAKFRNKSDDPQSAVRAFAAWGADLTRTFNGASGIYGGEALRPLGTMMFVLASASLGGQSFTPSAMLRVGVVKSETAFDDAQFLQGVWPEATGIAVQQVIVSV